MADSEPKRIQRRRTKVEVLLHVIEQIAGDDFCHDLECMVVFQPEKMTDREKECERKLGLIYKVVHSLNKLHPCHDAHDDWREQFRVLRQCAEAEIADKSIRQVRNVEARRG